jgi:hypothetical protein
MPPNTVPSPCRLPSIAPSPCWRRTQNLADGSIKNPAARCRAPGIQIRYDEIYSAFDQTSQADLFVHGTYRVLPRESAGFGILTLFLKIRIPGKVRAVVLDRMLPQRNLTPPPPI